MQQALTGENLGENLIFIDYRKNTWQFLSIFWVIKEYFLMKVIEYYMKIKAENL